MDISILCVFLSFIFIYASKVPVAVAMAQTKNGYNNRVPRSQQANLKGWGARALAGHNNSFESFVGFSAAMLFTHLSDVDARLMADLGLVYIASRFFYHALYILDWHLARSLVWSIGWGVICWLFVVSI